MSTTVTLNEPLSERPSLSVTVQLTGVVPSGNVEPDAGEHVGVGAIGSSASVAVAVNVTTAPDALVASAV